MESDQQVYKRAGEQRNGHAAAGDLTVASDDESLEALRAILLDDYRDRVADLRSQISQLQTLLEQMESQVEAINDPVALAAKITPSLAPAISTSIRESRDSMVDALYPIMGKLVTRAVTEALRDLARRIDEQMRSTLSIKTLTRRMQARVAGVSEAELVLRDVLPFEVLEIFLIYRESGLLLKALSSDPSISEDSDLISGMLTAIRDFVADAFGQEGDGELDEVQYGDRRILLESARYTYAAVVIRGMEPSGFRAEIREKLAEIELKHLEALLDYDGNAAQLVEAEPQLATLLQTNAAVQPKLPASPSPSPPVASSPADSGGARPAPAVRLLLWAIVALLALLLWRLWHVGQSEESAPDVVVFWFEIIRGTVIDYL